MAPKIDYQKFLNDLDVRLKSYFEAFGTEIACKKGCSDCCEKGDYPLSDIELEYLMKGFMGLASSTKIEVQKNIKNMVKGGACPFLLNKQCSIYPYRPIVCRVHGLAYFYKDEKVKLPHCVEDGKNFAKLYKEDGFYGNPIKLNLDTTNILKGLYAEIRNLYDWLNDYKY